MKKLFATMALALTFAVLAGSATPQTDMPGPTCYPCTPGSPQ